MSTIIKNLQKTTIQAQLQRYWIRHLRLFGSHAKWKSTMSSDVDLLYDFTDEDPSQLEWRWLFSALPYLENMLKKKIDLVNIKYIDPLLEKEIMDTKQLIF